MSAGAFRSDAGVSLVEIMVALFIVGLASGFVILSIPRSPTPLEEDRRSMEDMLTTTSRLAELSGEPLGVRFDDKAVGVLRFRDGVWQTPDDLRTLTGFAIDEDVRLDLPDDEMSNFRLANQEIVIEPDLWFDGSGLATAYAFQLKWKSSTYFFAVDQSGEVNVQSQRFSR